MGDKYPADLLSVYGRDVYISHLEYIQVMLGHTPEDGSTSDVQEADSEKSHHQNKQQTNKQTNKQTKLAPNFKKSDSTSWNVRPNLIEHTSK
jgi:hypothetical protein